MDIDARAFGQLEGEVKSLSTMMEAQTKTLDAQNKTLESLTLKLESVSNTLAEARGGWKTLLWIAGASASAAGVVTWLLQHITFKGGA